MCEGEYARGCQCECVCVLECAGERECVCVCESVSEEEDPKSLCITIITRHHRHQLFNQYIDIQVYIYI